MSHSLAAAKTPAAGDAGTRAMPSPIRTRLLKSIVGFGLLAIVTCLVAPLIGSSPISLARVFPLDHGRPVALRALRVREQLAAREVAEPQTAVGSRLQAPHLVRVSSVVPLDLDAIDVRGVADDQGRLGRDGLAGLGARTLDMPGINDRAPRQSRIGLRASENHRGCLPQFTDG